MTKSTGRRANDIKSPQACFGKLPKMRLDHEMIDLATELIARKAGRFKPEEFEDHYATGLKKLIEAKARGNNIMTPPEPEPKPSNVVNFIDALRSSPGKSGTNANAKSAPKKPSAKKARPATQQSCSK